MTGKPADPRTDAAEDISLLGTAMDRQLVDLTSAMTAMMTEKIPDLPRDAGMLELLTESVESNLRTAAKVFNGDVGVGELTAPRGAREYARRLAQRGVAPTALVRAYRIGQYMQLTWGFDELVRAYPDPARALAGVRTLLSVNFEYIDSVSEQVIEEYQAERERWLTHQNTVRAAMLARILAAEPVEIATAESALGYRLRQRHLGAVIWSDEPNGSAADLSLLEEAVGRFAKSVRAVGAPLLWPKDRASAWVWFPLGPDGTSGDRAAAAGACRWNEPGVRVALGEPGADAAGFRQTHLDALQAAHVATLGRDRARQVTSYTEPGVRAAALLARDLDGARRMVSASLGELASATEAAERLRETALAFLDERGSYLATAARLHLHKNTVKYRVAKAIQLRGRPLDEDRLDLELALIACHWLGAVVLQPAAS